ncbi:MAG: restriction endonuclease subunit R, partial [Planctomycetes bacterium]|nr:restriction endonuclease subunit R [Planctomycetota bacterium]
HHIPEDQIAIATGSTREIDNVDLFDRDCPLRFIITVQALKEGWDCSFAYVLCSVAEISSARSIEQLLGRILRLPRARRKEREELNCSYALVASRRFFDAAQTLKDALIENGFQRMEAEQFITPPPQGTLFGPGSLFGESTSRQVPETPDLSRLPEPLRERVEFNEQTETLTVIGELDEADMTELQECFSTPEARQAVEQIFHESQGRRVEPSAPAGTGAEFKVPQLALRVNGQLQLFDEDFFLDVEWKLSDHDAGLSEADFPSSFVTGQSGQVDVSDEGSIEIQFVDQMQKQLRLLGIEPGWDVPGLVNWLDQQIRHPDITRTESSLFLHNCVSRLMESRGLTVEQLAQQKFRLKNALTEKMDQHRRNQAKQSFQQVLFENSAGEVEVSPMFCFHFRDGQYAPNWYYEGSYQWNKHFFPTVGELKSDGEEFDCAVLLDQHPKVSYWVRNLERRAESAFWLQTSSDKFYPDFVAMLDDGRILIVEYKGEHLWSNDDSKEKRAIGELWAERSDGKCLFLMPKGPDWGAIQAAIG